MTNSTRSDLVQPEAWFVGIDQSYTGFGLVVLDSDGITIAEELWKFKKTEAERLWLIHDYLTWYLFDLKVKNTNLHMAMEGYAYGAKLNREKMGELGGVVKTAWYYCCETEPVIVAPTTLKKFVTGKGVASKEDMLASVNARWNQTLANHNVADAYGLAQYLKTNYCNIH